MMFIQFILNLFTKKVEVIPEPVKEEKEEKKFVDPPSPRKRYFNKKIVALHNNRKRTRGRYIQYTPEGRAIYHTIKRAVPKWI